jgi:hypothetical protein
VTFPATGETVVAYREQRNRVGDVARVDEQVIEGVVLAPRTSSEAGGDMRTATVRTGMTAYLPDVSGLTASHRIVRADGSVWRVSGTPAEWTNPFTGWEPGVQVEIDRVSG